MRVNTRRSLLPVVLLLLASVGSAAAQTGAILGRVTDTGSGNPLAGAVVEVKRADASTAGSGLTNQDGRYRITGIAPGSYTVVASYTGYRTGTPPNVEVTAGGPATADLALEQVAFDLDPVVVSVGKQEEKAITAPARVEVVSAAEVALRPAVTPVDHLRSVPGVDVITAGVQSTFVVVRGFNNIFSGALHTLTDNRIAGIPSLRVNLMHFIPQTNEDVSRMEVVLGPGAALYGPNTANGVLHIITKSPLEEQGTSVSVAGGERSLFQGSFRTAHKFSDRFGFKVSGQYIRAEEWFYQDTVEVNTKDLATDNPTAFRASLPLDVDGTPLTEPEIQQRIALIANRDFDILRYAGDVRADWLAASNLALTLSAGRTVAANGIELTGIGAAQVDDWAYSYYQLRARSGRFFGQAYLNTSDAGDTYLLRSGSPIVDKSKVFVGQLQHGLNLMSGRQRFTYGADYIRTMPETERTINGSNEDDDNYTEVGGYVQSETELTSRFNLTLAGRVDKHSELDDLVWSPRAALVFQPVEDQSFRLTYNRAFSTPTSLNLFLDIDGGPAGALGPFGFRVRAQGPGSRGFAFRDDAGNLFGIRTPFGTSSTTIVPITPATIYDLQVTAVQRAAAAAGTPIPAAVIGAMRNFRNDPAFAGLSLSILDALTQAVSPLATAQLPDVPAIKESITNTFEVGYKGIIGQRLLLAADVWHEKKTNFTSPLVVQTPLVLMTPAQLGAFLVPRLTAVFQVGGLPPAQAQAQAAAIANNIVRLPAGVISSPDIAARGADLLATYINFGEVEMTGVDLSATALLTDKLQLGVNASWTNHDFFEVPLTGQPDQIVALNAPKKKGGANLIYREVPVGFNGEFRVRYTDAFPVNSADFIGLECIQDEVDVDLEETGPCVKSYTLFDVTAGYAFPTIPGASVSFTVQNLFDQEYQSFIGVPEVGRMALLRFKYELGGAR